MTKAAPRWHTALITGATSGIGTAFAEILPEITGLLLTGRDEARLAVLAERYAKPGRIVETLPADLAEASGRRAVAEAAEAFGIDLFVNNAGLGIFGPLAKNDAAQEARLVAVNVTAVHELTRALLPGMIRRARERGSRAGVVIVSSVLGYVPAPLMTSYAASKAFDLFLAEGLAEELAGEPVDIQALCPGPVATEFAERAGVPGTVMPKGVSATKVARRSLAQLGRKRVVIVPTASAIALAPSRLFHRLAGSVVGRVMRSRNVDSD